MRMVKSCEGKLCEEWLRSLGLFSPEKRTLRTELIVICKFLMKGRGGAGTDLCSVVTIDKNLRGWPEVVSGEGLAGSQAKVLSPERGVDSGTALQGSGHSTSLTEFKKLLDNVLSKELVRESIAKLEIREGRQLTWVVASVLALQKMEVKQKDQEHPQQDAMLRNLHKLKKWDYGNLMEGQHQHRLGMNRWRAALGRRTWGAGGEEAGRDMAMGTPSPESQMCPGLHPKQPGQQGREGILPLCSVRPQLEPCISSGVPVQEGCGPAGESPEEVQQAD
ncbi:hypothetical protein TURU_004791 [Turdus rufiventris]|nr:hypothetical protein TURU_004791 [Turdus rufiventris]